MRDPFLRQQNAVRAAVDGDDRVRCRFPQHVDHSARPPCLISDEDFAEAGADRLRLAVRPDGPRAQPVAQRVDHLREIRCHREPDFMHAMVCRRCANGDDPLGIAECVEPARAHLDRVVAEEQDEIGFLDEAAEESIGARRQACRAKCGGSVLGHQPLGLIGRDDRCAKALQECAN